MPNTYFAKVSGQSANALFHFGIDYMRNFVHNSWPIWLALFAGILLAWRRRHCTQPEMLLMAVLVVYSAYVLRVGGDPVSAFPLWRHFVHIAPIWLFLTGSAICRFCSDSLRAVLVAAAVGMATAMTMCAETIVPASDLHPKPGFAVGQADSAYFDFVNRFTDRSTVAAVSLAGQWGWYVPTQNIDMLGLNNAHVAHSGRFQIGGAQDSKTDMAYVMAQHPAIIDGHDSGLGIRDGRCPQNLSPHGVRRSMLLGMFTSPHFLDDYYFVSNAPYEVLDRALFVHSSVAHSARAAGAVLIPLRETVLGDRACLYQ